MHQSGKTSIDYSGKISDVAVTDGGTLQAVLGPTNTGKTYYAIEQMLAHDTGVIGFPLRLLARENYDKLVKLKSKSQVALITGEEKIIPAAARYYVCTAESMPLEKDFDFVAIDEIQLCSDPDRGHIYTDRLLRARGKKQTMFLGSDTIKSLLEVIVPDIDIISRPRLSELKYTGFKKVTRIPKRSAVVAFSIDEVYQIADLIRRQCGGTAVVMGALSPRTRNRQVEMYQSGEVDYMVATDAIGMGLNMDIQHVALAGTRKFDGQRVRELSNAELAQVAGRAGRYKTNGTFGVTERVHDLDSETVEAIENHKFNALSQIVWRNSSLDFRSPRALLGSLEVKSSKRYFTRGRMADDHKTLCALMNDDAIMARASSQAQIRLLWETCQIPDFRKTMSEAHTQIISDIYSFLCDDGVIADHYAQERLGNLDKTEGDVDTLMARLAHIRTWTYITHKPGWLDRSAGWQEMARSIEDKLSDALHDALLKRFVDRRSAVLIQAMDSHGELMAGVKASGEVVVEGQQVGKLKAFRFYADDSLAGSEYYTVIKAARNALKPEIKRRIGLMLKAEDKQFSLNDKGELFYQANPTNPTPGEAIGRIKKGQQPYKPVLEVDDSDLLEGQDKVAVQQHVNAWLSRHLETVLDKLPSFENVNDEELSAPVRGICFQLYEAFGIVERAGLEDLIAELDEERRKELRSKNVRLGPVLAFMPNLNKPAAIKLKALLWNIWNDKELPAQTPNDGLTSYSVEGQDVNANYQRIIGYPVYGNRAIRVDILDRVISAVYDGSNQGKFQAKHEMAEWLGCSIADLYSVLEGLGHKKVHDPAEQEESKEAAPKEDAEVQEAKEEPKEVSEEVSEEGVQEEKPVEAVKAEAEKPELATFVLKRGKAYGGGRKKQRSNGKDASKGQKKFKSHPKKGKGKKSQGNKRTIVHSAKAEKDVSASPFAVLKDLKVQGKD